MSSVTVSGPELQIPFNENQNRDRDLLDFLNDVFAKFDGKHTVFAIEAVSGEQLTFEQLKSLSYVIARSLKNYNRIGVSMRPSIELIVTLVGIVRKGVTFVALDPGLPRDRLRLFEEDSAVDCVIYGSDVEPLSDPKSPWLTYSDMVSSNHEDVDSSTWQAEVNEKSTFCILYTSGSSGRPKGVQIPVSAVINRVLWQWKAFPFTEDDVPCIKTQIGFIDLVSEIWSPLLIGKPVVIIPKNILFEPEQLIKIMIKFKITRITLVPSLLKVIVDHIKTSKLVPKSLKYVITSGEALTTAIAKDFFNNFGDNNCVLANYYGSTEVMGDVTFETFKNFHDVTLKCSEGRLSIGSPIANTTLILLDPDENDIGELVISGGAVTTGYLNSVESDKFIESAKLGLNEELGLCFRTGDRVKLVTRKDYDGHSEYTFAAYYGRVDSQVKINGNRIDLSEVEIVLRNEFGLKVPVVMFEDNHILAFVSDEEQNAANIDREVLENNLPTVAVPEIVRVDKLPCLAVSGKVDRQKLLEIREQRKEFEVRNRIDWETFNELTGDGKKKFRTLVESMASSKIIGVCLASNYFKVGGTSLTLNAVLTISKLKLAGFRISIEQFLRATSLLDIVNNMVDDVVDTIEPIGLESESEMSISKDLRKRFIVMNANVIDRKAASNLFASNFIASETLTQIMLCGDIKLEKRVLKEMYRSFEELYDCFLHDDISFGMVDAQNPERLIGFAANVHDSKMPHKPPPIEFLTSSILTFMDEIEAPVLERLKRNGITKIMHGFVESLDNDFFPSSSDRIEMFLYMERKTIELAIEKGYQAIITANTSPLTQHLATEVLGYNVEHVADNLSKFVDLRTGYRPWKNAANQAVHVCVKYI